MNDDVKALDVHVPNNEHARACATCGGKCCLRMPGIYLPEDFGSSPEEVEETVRRLAGEGMVQVDWLEGEDPSFYVRPTAIDERVNSIHSPTWGGRCVNLTDAGCSLQFRERPHGCRRLIPNAESPGDCGDDAYPKKRDYAHAWSSFHEFLDDLEESVVRLPRWTPPRRGLW